MVSTIALSHHYLTLHRRGIDFDPVEILCHPIDGQADWFRRFREGDDVLWMADFHAVARFRNVRTPDRKTLSVRPEDQMRVRVKVDRFDLNSIGDDFTLLAYGRVQ